MKYIVTIGAHLNLFFTPLSCAMDTLRLGFIFHPDVGGFVFDCII